MADYTVGGGDFRQMRRRAEEAERRLVTALAWLERIIGDEPEGPVEREALAWVRSFEGEHG